MAELKTKPTKASVTRHIASLTDEAQRKDATALVRIFRALTGKKPVLWGTSIIGFGSYHYKSERSTQEGDWPRTGFAARKGTLTLYIMNGFKEYNALLKKLGPHKTGGSCLYVKRLSAIHLPTLKTIIKKSLLYMNKKYPK